MKIAALILLVLIRPAWAQQMPAGRPAGLGLYSGVTGGMSLGVPSPPLITYSGSTTPAGGASSTLQNKITASTPLAQDEYNSYSLFADASSLQFGDNVVFPDVGTVLSTNFYKVEIGGQYSRKLQNDRHFGARFSFGSASDRPFVSIRDMIFTASMLYGFPGNEHSHWLLTLFISNNSVIGNYVPIPGFVYLYHTPTFMGMFGLPFASILWKPVKSWAYALSFFGPTVNSEIQYNWNEYVQSFLAFNWNQQSYLRYARTLASDRIYFEEKKISLGLRLPFSPNFLSEVQAGYAFGRKVYEGSHFLRPDNGSADLTNSGFAAWNFKYLF